jgi:competence protein ComEC
LFFGNQAFAEIKALQQNRLIIYNHAHQLAIDYLSKNKYQFLGDKSIEKDEKLISNVLKPSRIYHRANEPLETNKQFYFYKNIISIHNKRIMVIDSACCFVPINDKIDVDVLVISKSPRLNFHEIFCAIQPKIIVFDASNSLWKITKWKKECETLNLRCFSIKDQGAFVMNLQ